MTLRGRGLSSGSKVLCKNKNLSSCQHSLKNPRHIVYTQNLSVEEVEIGGLPDSLANQHTSGSVRCYFQIKWSPNEEKKPQCTSSLTSNLLMFGLSQRLIFVGIYVMNYSHVSRMHSTMCASIMLRLCSQNQNLNSQCPL